MILVLDVILNRKFINANGGYKVTTSPEVALGKFLGFLFDPVGRFGFENLDSIRYGIFGWNDQIQMDVLITNVPLDDAKAFPFGNELEYSFEFLFNIVICQYLASVPWSPNDMVLAKVCAVFEVVEFG